MEGAQKKKRIVDMTQGSPLKVLIIFAVPLMLGSLLQQLYNTVDSIVVGRFVGTTALASVGTCGPILHLLIGFFIGFSHGATVTIASRFGAKDQEGMENAARSALMITFLFSIVLSLIGYFASPHLLRLINVPPDVLPGAVTYLRIQFIGVIALCFYNMTSALLRGLGDSTTPLASLAIACALNIVLDIVLVLVVPWGVAGVSIATVIAQACSAVYGLIMLYKKLPKAFKVSRDFTGEGTLWTTMRIGLPTAFQQSINSVGGMAMQSIVNSFGELFIAAGNVINRMDMFCTTPINSIGTAVSAYTGQNLGAGDQERVKKGMRSGMLMAAVFCAFMTAILIGFRLPIIRLFSEDPMVWDIAESYLFTIAPFYICLGISFVLTGIMRGSGHSLVTMIVSIFQIFCVRIPVAFYFCNVVGHPRMIYFAMGCGWTAMLIVLSIYYRSGKWRKDLLGTGGKKEAAVVADE